MDQEVIIIEEDVIDEQTAVSPANTSRRIIMASIGMMATVGSEAASFANRIIENDQVTSEISQPLATSQKKLRRGLKNTVGRLLNRMNVPTKSDIDNLNNQITNLLDKVETLQQQAHNPPAPPSTYPEDVEAEGSNEQP